ncbi:MAG: haloalkane dehalogenase [Bacteroidota bacterium]
MQILRTPEERFANLPDYPFEPHYFTTKEGIRIHYVDSGNHATETVLMLHGEPSWSYLYRHMITAVSAAGYRVLAPDLVGFGKSDKPAERSDYTYQSHVDWLEAWLLDLNLTNITLFCQDWGGLLGLRLAGMHPDRFARIIAANTFLPNGQGKMPAAFEQWKNFSQTVPIFPIGKILQNATVSELSPEVVAAYDAPFPDETYKAGARVFPALVPASAEDPAIPANLKAWEVLMKWEKPFLTAFSDQDPITRGADKIFQKLIPGTKDQPHTTIEQGGHFLQEDQSQQLSQVIIDCIQSNPLS